MHEAAFANAALPRRTTILKLPMRDYCLAHELWLMRNGNELVCGAASPATGEASIWPLIEAVWICAHTHEELLAIERGSILSLLKLVWLLRIRKADFKKAAQEFLLYVQGGSNEPEVLEAIRRGQVEHRRAAGAPFVLRVRQFLRLTLRLSESEAMNYPCGLAKWEYYAYWEGEDACRIKNGDEESAELEIAAVKALMAEGMEMGEAFKKVRQAETTPKAEPVQEVGCA